MLSIIFLTITVLVFDHTSGSYLVPKLDKRIVNGVDADISEFPHQLSLELIVIHVCGASILKSNVALTAAHCYNATFQQTDYAVRAGSSISRVGGQVVKVRHFHLHEKYSLRTLDYDVAVVLLADHLYEGSRVQLAPRGYRVPDGTVCLASGWGYLYEFIEIVSDRLQKVQLHVINRETCQKLNERRPRLSVTSRMICTYEYPKGPCKADSGGALMADGVQVGIVSWSHGCARMNLPTVYTNIGNPEIYDFIMDKSNY